MDLTKILTDILFGVSSLLGAYITLYFAKGKVKVDAEIEKIKDDKLKALINVTLERIGDLVVKGVGAAQQTLVPDLKKQIAEGTASKADLEKIGQDVANNVYGQLNTNAILALQSEYNDVKGYIEASVEAQVLKLKITIASVVIPTAVKLDAVELPVKAETVVSPAVAEIVEPVVEPVVEPEVLEEKVVETAIEDKIVEPTPEVVTPVAEITPEPIIPIIPETPVLPIAEVVVETPEPIIEPVAPIVENVVTEPAIDVTVDVPVAPVVDNTEEILRVNATILDLQKHVLQLQSDAQGTIVAPVTPII